MDSHKTDAGLVSGFGVFKFDLNVGQTCEFLHPSGLVSDECAKCISMLCFPDSQSIATKSTTVDCLYYFTYRFRSSSIKCTQPASVTPPLICCYVYFRQVEDVTSARGYYQKSFVLFSNSPSVQEDLLSYTRSIGLKYFLAESAGCGVDVLVDALVELNKFQSDSVPLSRSSTVFDDPNHIAGYRRQQLSIGQSHIDISDLFFSFLDALWYLWESIMVGIPVLVYADEPDIVCHMVTELNRLISPFPPRTNTYPYLSIFDPQYSAFIKHVPTGSIVGVTSPMAFEQLRVSFPVLLCITSDNVPTSSSSHIKVCDSMYGSVWLSDSITSVSSGTRDRMTSIMRNWSPIATEDSSYRLSIPSESETVRSKLVMSNINNDDEFSKSINRGIIRNYFHSLTRDFLIPFVRYIELDSLAIRQNPTSKTPICEKFCHRKFLSSLAPIGFFQTSVPSHKIHVLYDKFIRTSHFHDWLVGSQESSNIDSVILHATILSEKFVKSPLFVERIHAVVNLTRSIDPHHKHPALAQSAQNLINLLDV